MPQDTRAAFLRALETVEPRLRNRISEAIANMRNEASLRLLIEAIEARDIEAVMAAANLTEASFSGVREALREAFLAGMIYQIERAPVRMVRQLDLIIDPGHRRAESFWVGRAGELITEVLEDQRRMIREMIEVSLRENRGYRAIARDLVGEIVGNQRRGGLIGLHSNQARAVANFRAILADAEALRATFGGDPANWPYKLRNRAFDRSIAKAIREGRAMDAGRIDKMTRHYSDAQLRLRARTIARTEGNKMMNAGRAEATRQMIESGEVPADAVTTIWDATPDGRTRDSHRHLNGAKVRFGEPFSNGLRWPHDRGPARETVNCRCSARFRVDWLSLAR